MREQDYRRAVKSLRFSQEKRSRIENILKAPPDIDPDIDPVTGDFSGGFTVTYKDYERLEEEEMKFRKHHYIGLALVGASLLLCGGVAGAVAYMGRGHSEDSQQSSQQESKNDSKNDTEQIVNSIISPKLTDQTDNPNMRGYAQMDSGMFYMSHEYYSDNYAPDPRAGGYYEYMSGQALCYYDEETAQSVYLCQRPNCTHRGDTFCTATTANYKPLCDPVWLEDSIYLIALDQTEKVRNPESNSRSPVVLLKYAPDGSEISKVIDIFTDYTDNPCEFEQIDAGAELIAHRGQLWMSVWYEQNFTLNEDDLAPGTPAYIEYAGYQLSCYEPAAQKLTQLGGTKGLLKSYHRDTVASDLGGYGDYVIFRKSSADWQDSIKNQGIYRLDCRTGEIVSLSDTSSYRVCYAVIGNNLYYFTDDRKDSSWDAPRTFMGICRVDLTTLEKTVWKDYKEDFAKKVWPEFSYDNKDVQKQWFGIYSLYAIGDKLLVEWDCLIPDPTATAMNGIGRTGVQYTLFSEDKQTVHEYKYNDLEQTLPEDMLRKYIKCRWWEFSEKKAGGLTDADVDKMIKEKWYRGYTDNLGPDGYGRNMSEGGNSHAVLYDGEYVYLQCEFGMYRMPYQDFTEGKADPQLLFWHNHYFD